MDEDGARTAMTSVIDKIQDSTFTRKEDAGSTPAHADDYSCYALMFALRLARSD